MSDRCVVCGSPDAGCSVNSFPLCKPHYEAASEELDQQMIENSEAERFLLKAQFAAQFPLTARVGIR